MNDKTPERPLRRNGAVRTALFVDFDNIYIGLNSLDTQSAESFGCNPAGWLQWIECGMPSELDGCEDLAGGQRSVLIRNCYLNPRTFYRFRPYFTRAAFSIVDCPPLTEKGKTSTDIRMVMDVLDTLTHETRFDEYIILSGDADFTPVLQRLRAHDRRTTVLAVGPASEAYKSACDHLISVDSFIEFALGVSGVDTAFYSAETSRPTGEKASEDLLDRIAELIYERASADGEILAANLPRIYADFEEFRSSKDWLGYGSLRRLTQSLVDRRKDLRLIETDPWKVGVALEGIGDGGHPYDSPDESGTRTLAQEELRRRVAEFVQRRLTQAPQPLLMAQVAQEVISEIGQEVLETQWAGAGTFRALIEAGEDHHVAVHTAPGLPAYLYEPGRHVPPSDSPARYKFADLPLELAGFIQRIHNLTHTPDLTPKEYSDVFGALERVLQNSRYHFTGTSKMVRDQCIEEGHSISRAAISFILRGISYGGHRFGQKGDKDSAVTFAEVFRENVLNLCADAQLDLNEIERRLLADWITAADPVSGPEAPSGEADASPDR